MNFTGAFYGLIVVTITTPTPILAANLTAKASAEQIAKDIQFKHIFKVKEYADVMAEKILEAYKEY